MRLSSEDVASVLAVVGVLEAQAAALSPISKVAGMWRDWSDMLKPSAVEGIGEPR